MAECQLCAFCCWGTAVQPLHALKYEQDVYDERQFTSSYYCLYFSSVFIYKLVIISNLILLGFLVNVNNVLNIILVISHICD